MGYNTVACCGCVWGVASLEMPKKFKEVNSKAVEARERKAAVKKEVDERKKKEQEDEYWRDDDKHVKRKQDRKVSLKFFHRLAVCVYIYNLEK